MFRWITEHADGAEFEKKISVIVTLQSSGKFIYGELSSCCQTKNIHHTVIPEEAVRPKSEHWRWNQFTKVCNFVKVLLSFRPKQGNTPVFKGAFQPFWLSTSVIAL